MRHGNRRLFIATVVAPLRSHGARTALAIFAIALGVALGLAIHLVNQQTIAASRRAGNALFGAADLVVVGTPEGFDENVYPVVARVPGVALASPVLETRVRIANSSNDFTIIGIELLRAAGFNEIATVRRSRDDLSAFDVDRIVITETAAHDLALSVGDALHVQVGTRWVDFKVGGIAPGTRALALLDIAAAQWKLERLGRLTRIDVRIAPGMDPAVVARSIEKRLPNSLRVTTQEDAIEQSLDLSRAFRVNLTALALVALFTGGFLIYGTQSLQVIRRRREFALLHALGMTMRQRLSAVIASGVILGIAGSSAGLILGVTLARHGAPFLFGNLGVGAASQSLETSALALTGFWALGVVAAIMGSIAPAKYIARVPTSEALKAGDLPPTLADRSSRFGFILWIVAAPLVFAPPIFDLPVIGYCAIALILLGAVLAIPSLTGSILRALPRGRGPTYRAAVGQLRSAAQTASQSVAAILVSTSLMVAMAIMVASLRGSFAESLDRLLPGDIYVQYSSSTQGSSTYLDEATTRRIAALPGVVRVSPTRSVSAKINRISVPVTLVARHLDGSLSPTRGASGPIPVKISVALADRYHLKAHDRLNFDLSDQRLEAVVTEITRDYINQSAGVIVMDYGDYRELTGDRRVNSVAVWTDPSTEPGQVMNAMRSLFDSGPPPEITRPGEIRERSLKIFDGVFAITYFLLGVAVLIGMFGISVNASAQVLVRRAEFGLLRYLGFTRRQLVAMLGIEGLCVGAFGTFCGFFVGAIVSAVLILVVGRQSFHWVMQLHIPVPLLATLAIGVPLSAMVTTLWSARAAIGDDVVHALREDW